MTYFPDGEVIPPEVSADLQGFDLFDDVDLRHHPRLRRVVTTMVHPTPGFYGVLHWSDGTDLHALDERVRRGEASDGDFSGAVLAELRTVVCRSCESHLRALVIDTGQALFASSLPKRLQRHAFNELCPVCSERLGLLLVEFLGVDAGEGDGVVS